MATPPASVVPATPPVTITFVTGNAGKLHEVRLFLAASSGTDEPAFELTSQEIDLPELQGEPAEIAAHKCRMAAERVHGPVIVEDTSLCFNALEGLPGPYVKHFLAKTGCIGLTNMLAAYEDKTAYAQTIFAFSAGPGCEPQTFDGRVKGRIVPARGPTSFGWDPVFLPDGYEETYAEMTKETKAVMSHRTVSLKLLQTWLLEHADTL